MSQSDKGGRCCQQGAEQSEADEVDEVDIFFRISSHTPEKFLFTSEFE